MNKKIVRFIKKKHKKPIVMLTAYSNHISKLLDKHCDAILVGDSLANTLYGMKNTHKVNLKTMIEHSKSVRKGIKNSLLIVDMPKDSYGSKKTALKNAIKLIKETKCDAIKVESNFKNQNIINYLVNFNIPVMGHIGFTPQYMNKFKVRGVTKNEEKKLIAEAIKLQEAGAFGIVLECIVSKVSKKITNSVKIPTIGIGSSINCDGQILVTDDLIGLSGFYPKFVKKYCNISDIIEKSIKKYSKDVRKKIFPKKVNSY